MNQTAETPDHQARFRLRCCLPLVMAVLLGAVLCITPNISHAFLYGRFDYYADTDDLLYAMIARTPLAGSATIGDHHSARAAGSIPSTYAWGQFVPVGWIVGRLGGGGAEFLLAWRFLGGMMLAGAIYAFFRSVCAQCSPWVACFLCVVCVSDPSLRGGLPLISIPGVVQQWWQGVWVRNNPGLFAHLHALQPLGGVPIVLTLILITVSKQWSWCRTAICGLLLGVLCNLYFFFWTFSAVYLLSLFVWRSLVERLRTGQQQSVAHLVAIALLIGLLLGSVQIFANVHTASLSDSIEAMERTPRKLSLERDNPIRWNYLKSVRTCAAFVLGSWLAYFHRSRVLVHFMVAALISFALQASAVLTGLEFENYKWGHIGNICSSLVILAGAFLFFTPRVNRNLDGRVLVGSACAAVMMYAFAISVVWCESVGTELPREIVAMRQRLVPLTQSLRQAASARSQIAGVDQLKHVAVDLPSGVLFGEHSFQSLTSDRELLERAVLNGYLLGWTRQQMLDRQEVVRLPRNGMLMGERRERWRPEHVKQMMGEIYDQIDASWIDRYAVSAVLAPAEFQPSEVRSSKLVWKRLQASDDFAVWSVRALHRRL